MTKRTPLFAVVTLALGGPAGASPTTTTPRTLRSGAPACGNAQSKGPRRCAEPPAPAQTVVAPPAATELAPRTLVTGAPACGNVLDKVYGNTRDPLYQACLAGEGPALVVEVAMQVRRVLTLFGMVDDARMPAATPRQLRDGAPAPGNVATRATPRGDGS